MSISLYMLYKFFSQNSSFKICLAFLHVISFPYYGKKTKIFPLEGVRSPRSLNCNNVNARCIKPYIWMISAWYLHYYFPWKKLQFCQKDERNQTFDEPLSFRIPPRNYFNILDSEHLNGSSQNKQKEGN